MCVWLAIDLYTASLRMGVEHRFFGGRVSPARFHTRSVGAEEFGICEAIIFAPHGIRMLVLPHEYSLLLRTFAMLILCCRMRGGLNFG